MGIRIIKRDISVKIKNYLNELTILCKCFSSSPIAKNEPLAILTFDAERDFKAGEGYTKTSFEAFDVSIDFLLDLAEKHDLKYTFFVTQELVNARAEKLREVSQTHEIGAHVHPFTFGCSDDRLPTFSYQKQFLMINNVTKATQEKLGIMPKAFRAGRCSRDKNTFRVLEKLDYRIDSSFVSVFYKKPLFYLGKILEIPVDFYLYQKFSPKNVFKGNLIVIGDHINILNDLKKHKEKIKEVIDFFVRKNFKFIKISEVLQNVQSYKQIRKLRLFF